MLPAGVALAMILLLNIAAQLAVTVKNRRG